jgi:hypothetical protein
VSGALFPDRIPDLPTVKVDVTHMDFRDEEFDVLVCTTSWNTFGSTLRAWRRSIGSCLPDKRIGHRAEFG